MLEDDDITGVGALVDPVRRALYAFVCAQPGPTSREAAAAALDIPLHQAKFHLDRLVREGLLDTGHARLSGRTGPGAGRPAKLYRRADREIAVTLPERRYALAGDLLAEGVSDAAAEGGPVAEAVTRAAARRGREIGREYVAATERPDSAAAATALAMRTLAEQGYEPRAAGEDDATIVLANCPFHALARAHTALVCGMNLALLDGILEEVPGHPLRARLDPAEGRCCVVCDVAR